MPLMEQNALLCTFALVQIQTPSTWRNKRAQTVTARLNPLVLLGINDEYSRRSYRGLLCLTGNLFLNGTVPNLSSLVTGISELSKKVNLYWIFFEFLLLEFLFGILSKGFNKKA